MEDLVFPDYKKSIINLMSSICKGFGYNKKDYCEIDCLPSSELRKYKTVILIVVDGLGYNYLMNFKKSFLRNTNIERISSVFLPTTACANTVFHTAQSPNETGMTGWFTYLREMGIISAILPFIPKTFNGNLSEKYCMKDFINIKSIYSKLKADSYVIIEKSIAYSDFSKLSFNGAKVVPRESLKDAFVKLDNLIKSKSKNRRFISVYISEFDHSCHDNGTNSSVTKKIFEKIDSLIKKSCGKIKGKDDLLLVTADHGFSDSKKDEVLALDDFPKLKECVIMPLSTENRVVSVFVKPSMYKQFGEEVKNHSKYFMAMKGEDVIKKRLYGTTKDHEEFKYRVGDYMLFMKNNYIMIFNKKDKNKTNKGNHCGLSENEMIVPLIKINSHE